MFKKLICLLVGHKFVLHADEYGAVRCYCARCGHTLWTA